MKKKDIKKLSKDQARKELEKCKKDLFNFWFQKINGQLKDYSKITMTKKNIARLRNILEYKNA